MTTPNIIKVGHAKEVPGPWYGYVAMASVQTAIGEFEHHFGWSPKKVYYQEANGRYKVYIPTENNR